MIVGVRMHIKIFWFLFPCFAGYLAFSRPVFPAFKALHTAIKTNVSYSWQNFHQGKHSFHKLQQSSHIRHFTRHTFESSQRSTNKRSLLRVQSARNTAPFFGFLFCEQRSSYSKYCFAYFKRLREDDSSSSPFFCLHVSIAIRLRYYLLIQRRILQLRQSFASFLLLFQAFCNNCNTIFNN